MHVSFSNHSVQLCGYLPTRYQSTCQCQLPYPKATGLEKTLCLHLLSTCWTTTEELSFVLQSVQRNLSTLSIDQHAIHGTSYTECTIVTYFDRRYFFPQTETNIDGPKTINITILSDQILRYLIDMKFTAIREKQHLYYIAHSMCTQSYVHILSK